MKNCKFCRSPDREKLERALIRDEISQVEVARILSIDQSNVSRHIDNHVKKQVREAVKQDQSLAEGLNVTEQLRDINKEARTILDKAKKSGDHKLALRAIEVVLKQLEMQAKLLGDIKTGLGINVMVISAVPRPEQ